MSNPTLKAYWMQYKDAEWGIYLHGYTRGEAKARFKRKDPSSGWDGEWNQIRGWRMPELDDTAITYANCEQRKVYYSDDNEEGVLSEADFVMYCDCELCSSAAQQKAPGY